MSLSGRWYFNLGCMACRFGFGVLSPPSGPTTEVGLRNESAGSESPLVTGFLSTVIVSKSSTSSKSSLFMPTRIPRIFSPIMLSTELMGTGSAVTGRRVVEVTKGRSSSRSARERRFIPGLDLLNLLLRFSIMIFIRSVFSDSLIASSMFCTCEGSSVLFLYLSDNFPNRLSIFLILSSLRLPFPLAAVEPAGLAFPDAVVVVVLEPTVVAPFVMG